MLENAYCGNEMRKRVSILLATAAGNSNFGVMVSLNANCEGIGNKLQVSSSGIVDFFSRLNMHWLETTTGRRMLRRAVLN